MSSRLYLRGEARWARESQLRCQREVDELQNPKGLARARASAASKYWRAKADLERAEEAFEALSDDELTETIAAKQQDVDRWAQLASEYERRICDDEDAPTLDGTES